MIFFPRSTTILLHFYNTKMKQKIKLNTYVKAHTKTQLINPYTIKSKPRFWNPLCIKWVAFLLVCIWYFYPIFKSISTIRQWDTLPKKETLISICDSNEKINFLVKVQFFCVPQTTTYWWLLTHTHTPRFLQMHLRRHAKECNKLQDIPKWLSNSAEFFGISAKQWHVQYMYVW